MGRVLYLAGTSERPRIRYNVPSRTLCARTVYVKGIT
jgi:hypothetical protein